MSGYALTPTEQARLLDFLQAHPESAADRCGVAAYQVLDRARKGHVVAAEAAVGILAAVLAWEEGDR